MVITAIALAATGSGVLLSSLDALARRVVPMGGGILIGVALLWVLPEMAGYWNWAAALGWLMGGFALLWVTDRYISPVCPSCSHSHDHEHGTAELEGFGPPLLIAAGLHSALDGWSVVAADRFGNLGGAFVLAVAVHKIPEGIALGVIARAAFRSRGQALAWSSAAELMTMAGALLEIELGPLVGDTWLHVLLAIAGGAFLYLGGHAVHSEWKHRGAGAAIYPAIAGFAGLGALRLLG